MIEIELGYILSSGSTDKDVTLRGNLRNVGRAGVPVIECELEMPGERIRRHGCVRGEVLWSFPLPDLAKYAIGAAIASPGERGESIRSTLSRATLTLMCGRVELMDVTCTRPGAGPLLDSDHAEIDVRGVPLTPWRLAQRLLAHSVTKGANSFESVRMPPVHYTTEFAYCRSSQLPEEFRADFEKQHCFAPQPEVRGLPDAYYAADVARWLTLFSTGVIALLQPHDGDPAY